jgi:hypothetical protein
LGGCFPIIENAEKTIQSVRHSPKSKGKTCCGGKNDETQFATLVRMKKPANPLAKIQTIRKNLLRKLFLLYARIVEPAFSLWWSV